MASEGLKKENAQVICERLDMLVVLSAIEIAPSKDATKTMLLNKQNKQFLPIVQSSGLNHITVGTTRLIRILRFRSSMYLDSVTPPSTFDNLQPVIPTLSSRLAITLKLQSAAEVCGQGFA